MFSMTDVGGQHCPCPVRVSFLSGFSGKFWPVSVRCPDSVRIFCQVSVCPESVCLDSVRCPDFEKKGCAVSVCPDFFVLILSAVGILSGIVRMNFDRHEYSVLIQTPVHPNVDITNFENADTDADTDIEKIESQTVETRGYQI